MRARFFPLRVGMAMLALCLAGAARGQEVKVDLDRIFGMTRAELSRYVQGLAENVEVSGWKGFRKATFVFNAKGKLIGLTATFPDALSEAEAIKLLEGVFEFKLYSGKALRAPAEVRFEDVSAGTKAVVLPVVKIRESPQTFGRAELFSRIGYHE